MILKRERHILIFALILYISFSNCQNEDCNRRESRQAHEIIKKFILPRAKHLGHSIPDDCLLNLKNNIFEWQEAHKTIAYKKYWKCTFCEKMFKNEDYLDRHMNRKHEGEVREGAFLCFADFCPLLHCHFFFSNNSQAFSGLTTFTLTSPCDPLEENELQSRCTSIFRNCFPPSAGHESLYLFEFFKMHFCDSHLCSENSQELLSQIPIGRKEEISLIFDMYAIMIALTVLWLMWTFRQRAPRRPRRQGASQQKLMTF